MIIEYLACKEAGGIPVFLSHISEKTPKLIWEQRLKNWQKLGIKKIIPAGLTEDKEEEIENIFNISFLQLSSGTTSSQKAFGISEKKLKKQLKSYSSKLSLDKDSVIVSWLPVYHDMGLITSIFLPLYLKCKVVIIPTFEWIKDYGSLIDKINEHKGTHCWLPNFCFEKLSEIENKQLNVQCQFINCSEICREKSVNMFLEKYPVAKISTCYALAENVFAATQSEVDNITSNNGILNSGTVIDGVELKILDNGQIFLSGECIFDASLKEGTFIKQDSLYDTGDLGYIKDGLLYVTGRTKECIKVFGKQIFLPDIEKEINELKLVHKGRVVSFGLNNLGTEKLVILYEAQQNYDREIRKTIYEIFEISPVVQRIPKGVLLKTSSGKICRSLNQDIYNKYLTAISVVNEFLQTKIDIDMKLKSDGYLDSFSVMEVLNELSLRLNKKINWKYDFKLLDDIQSFLEALE